MPISAEQERILLNKYHLTSLYPTEWPHKDNESSEEEEDDDVGDESTTSNGNRRQNPASSVKSRFRKIDRHASLRGIKQTDAGVQKDEPDALGMIPSVAAQLRKRGLPVEENLALRNKFMLSSTSFSPAMYLSQVHQNATTDDLLRGLDYLSRSIEQKSASLKILVESNFERFVRAKSTIDAVYTEMRTQGVEEQRTSQVPPVTTLRAQHSRQSSARHSSHFRHSSGIFTPQPRASMAAIRKNALTKESEYGVQGIRVPLQELAIKAEEVWGPALGGREKEETLKAVTTALEKHKEIFQLSGILYDAIQKNDYDSVVDSYRQANQFADKARRIAEDAQDNNVELRESEAQQIIVTAKMWHDVYAQIIGFKREIWKRLKTSHGHKPDVVASESGKEEHMELIGLLMQLDVDENPIWEWVNSRYLYLKVKIARTFERSRIEIEILRRRLANGHRPDNESLAKHLRSVSNTSGTLKPTTDVPYDMDTAVVIGFWEKVQSSMTALLSLPNGVLGEVVEWWEIAQSFIDGKAQKAFPPAVFNAGLEHLELDPDHVRNIRSGAVELINLLREAITSFFTDSPVEDLSDLYSPISPSPITPESGKLTPSIARVFTFDPNNIPPPSPKRGDIWEKFAFWAPNSNSLSASLYLSRLIAMVGTCAGELAALGVVRNTGEREKLKSMVNSVRERCIQAICAAWNTDAERCKVLESWIRSPERRDLTFMPAYFEAWEERLLSNMQKVAYISEAATGKHGANAVEVIISPPAKLLQTVRSCFVTSLYKALSGLVENAERTRKGNSVDTDPDGVTVPSKTAVAGFAVLATDAVDSTNKNVRMLMTLSNLNHLRGETIPQLINHFETAFSVKLTEESKTIRDVLGQIDARLFQSYVKPTISQLSNIITNGVTSDRWEPRNPRPTDASPYIYDVLLVLVLVHSEVTSTTTSALTLQILSHLLEQSSQALIHAFQQRARYTLPALMQATLDVEFLAQTLKNYTTERASEVQSQIYVALDERTDNDARAKLQGELPDMRNTLKKLREGTKGEFGCFRHEKRGREGRSATVTNGAAPR